MWFIWKERCDRVFEEKFKSATNLALEIQRYVDFWSTKKRKSAKPSQAKRKNLIPVWKAPSKDNLKINVDATWISEALPYTYALILRNDTGDCQGGRAGHSTGSDPQEAEAIGVLQAEIWAKDNQIQRFSIEGDCESLFNYILGKKEDILWRAKAYINEAIRIASFCTNFLGFFYVPRLENQVADILTKFVRPLISTVEWELSSPACTLRKLFVDKPNIGVTQNPILDGSTSIVISAPLES
ncbi:uncharacterized protein LOC113290620 [Papaver somniferum]|uniref:uncharacterized protein LOC113290620 n=1 Tax=Papaver somniferum TaxID=3469 RepID=UPI000E6F7462|nr:uncharacterized protein LOC113290620 [Papaver somniferum]